MFQGKHSLGGGPEQSPDGGLNALHAIQTTWDAALDGPALEPGIEAQVTMLHPVQGPASFRHADPSRLVDQGLHASSRGCHVLVGLHLRGGQTVGAGGEGVRLLMGAVADVDTRAHGLVDEAAMEALVGAPWGAPTVVIHSGGGFHAVWAYREPLDALDAHDLEQHRRACEVARAWLHSRLEADCCDPAHRPTQSIRLPATVNWKAARRRADGSFPIVLLARQSQQRFNPGDLLDWEAVLWEPGGGSCASDRDEAGAQVGPPGQQASTQPPLSSALPGLPRLKDLPGALAAVLEAAGVSFAVKRDAGGVLVLVPAVCPACGSEVGSCYVIPQTGRLRSHRARRCPAGGPSGTRNGAYVGLPLAEWIERYAPEALSLVPPDGVLVADPLLTALLDLPGTGPVTEAAALPGEPDGGGADLTNAATDRFNVHPVLRQGIAFAGAGINRLATIGISPPGAGKTTAASEELVQHAAATRRGFALLLASHRLADEKTAQLAEIAARYGVEDRVVHVLGQAKLCPNGSGLGSAYRKGYVGRDRELHRLACGYGGCAYSAHIEGIGAKSIKVATHAHLPFLYETGRLSDNVVVIDELAALHEDIRLECRDFQLASGAHAMRYMELWLQPMNSAANIMVRALRQLEGRVAARTAAATPPFAERIAVGDRLDLLLDAVGGERADLFQALEQAAAVKPEDAPSPPKWAIKANNMARVPRADLPLFFATVLAELRGEAGPRTGSVACFGMEGRGTEARVWLEWRVRKKLPDGISVVMLDATASITEPVLRAAFPDKETRLFSHEIAMPGPEDGLHAYFITHKSLNRRRLFRYADGQAQVTVRGAASIRNVLRMAKRLARRHLPPGPPTAVTAPRPATRALTDEAGILGEFRALVQAAGDTGEVAAAYHFGLRGSNALESATLFVNIGDPVGNLGALREEARLFGLESEDYAQRMAASELIQTLHRSRALRVTLDRPKVVIHAGRYPMVGFHAQTIRLGSGPAPSDERLATEDFAELLLEHGGLTAPWLADEVAGRVRSFCSAAGGVLAGPLEVAGGGRAFAGAHKVWRRLYMRRSGIEVDTLRDPRRPAGTRGGPRRLYRRVTATAAGLLEDFDGWLDRQAEAVLPCCCADEDGTPVDVGAQDGVGSEMESSPFFGRFPSDETRGEPSKEWTAANLAALRLIEELL